MSLNIGRMFNAASTGVWIKVPAVNGEFWLRVKPDLPGKAYMASKEISRLGENGTETYKAWVQHLAEAITDWRGLLDAGGKEMEFSDELRGNEVFIDALFSERVAGDDPDKPELLLAWLQKVVLSPEAALAQEDPSFLAST